MSSKRARVTETSSFMQPSTLDSAVADLKQHGYFWLPRAVPVDLCLKCRDLIQADVGGRLDSGSPHQEEPCERLNEDTAHAMREMQTFIVKELLLQTTTTAAAAAPHVPEEFSDTLYGRVKRRHFHTAFHCDAFNTVFQRRFLTTGSTHSSKVGEFLALGTLPADVQWNDVPIYTFWVCLSPVHANTTSHLRIRPQSHLDRTVTVTANNVLPAAYKYSAKHFVGPDFKQQEQEGGYQVGDLVVFHCLTLHEANAHRQPNNAPHQERVSLDGRFVWELT